jgi:hypothetical protein
MNLAKWSYRAAAVAIFGVAGSGCVVNVHEHRGPEYARPVYEENAVVVEPPVYEPQRVVIVDEPPAGYVRVVRTAPPPPYAEVRTAPRGPDYVWIDGYWVAHNGHWVWVRGRWERPPHRGAHWEAHVWERHGDRFELRVGGWR